MYRSKLLVAAVATVAGLAGPLLADPASASATVSTGGPDTPVSTGEPVGSAPAPSTGLAGAGEVDDQPGLSASPAGGRAGIEIIIGDDNRTRVNPTTALPASAIVNITGNDGGTTFGCSGWLYGPSIVATAGHCVHPGAGQDGGGSNGFYPTEDFVIIPGRNFPSRPFGTCNATQLMSVNGWTQDGNSEFDYGAIRLDCDMSTTARRLNFWWQSATLTGTATTVSGYPCDKTFGEQWQHGGRTVLSTTTRRIFYDNDTFGCQSGSPVFQNRAAGSQFCAGWCVMAIHTGATGSQNRGTRITESVFNNLIAWRG
jgi:glutamyl endopeptidase